MFGYSLFSKSSPNTAAVVARVPRSDQTPPLSDSRRRLRVAQNGKDQAAVCFEATKESYSHSRDCGRPGKIPGGKILETCSMLTTTPNAVTSTLHDRMPWFYGMVSKTEQRRFLIFQHN